MKNLFIPILLALLFAIPMMSMAQRKKNKNTKDTVVTVVAVPVPVAVDSIALAKALADSLALADTIIPPPIPDTPVVVAAKDCFQDWYEKMRTRGAKEVTDGMHPVVITLKSEEAAVCLMGQVQVTGGKIVPPLMIQQEDGEYKPFNAVGKKLDPGFVSSMTEDELLKITDGMSILFRTTNQEYGRLIFYTFANKSAKSNKTAPNPDDLLQ